MAHQQLSIRPEVMRTIDRFNPHNIHPDIWSEIAPLVLDATRKVVPATTYKATVVAGQATRIANWCWRRGLGIDPEIVFHPDTIEEFIERECAHLTPGTQLNYRSQLRQIGEVLLGPPLYGPRAKPRRMSERLEPYTPNEIAALVGVALSCPTKRQSHGAMALIVAGLGVGLPQAEMARVSGACVVREQTGVFVEVAGRNERRVPVRGCWQDQLVELADHAGGRPLILPHLSSVSPRQLSRLTEDIDWRDAPKLSIQRLRITWMLALLNAGVHVNVISQVAGIRGEQVGEYVQYMVPADGQQCAREVRRA